MTYLRCFLLRPTGLRNEARLRRLMAAANILFAFGAVLLATSVGTPAHAATRCECGAPKSLDEYTQRAWGIFVGEVRTIRRMGTSNRMRVFFDVDAVWKGADSKEISVIAVQNSPLQERLNADSCGYTFEAGQQYVVFAYRRTNDLGPGWTSSCWPTTRADTVEGQDYIQRLGEPLTVHSQSVLPADDAPQGITIRVPAPTNIVVETPATQAPTPLPPADVQPYLLPGKDGKPHVQLPYIGR